MTKLNIALLEFDKKNRAKEFGDFAVKAYALGLNPLPGLRKAFNSYNWSLFKDTGVCWSDVLEMAKQAIVMCGLRDEATELTVYLCAVPKPGTTSAWKKHYWEFPGLTSSYKLTREDQVADLKELGFTEIKL